MCCRPTARGILKILHLRRSFPPHNLQTTSGYWPVLQRRSASPWHVSLLRRRPQDVALPDVGLALTAGASFR